MIWAARAAWIGRKAGGQDGHFCEKGSRETEQWKRTKAKVKGAVKEIARELVELYAARQETAGFQYSQDSVWQREFEELFHRMCQEGSLSERQRIYYSDKLEELGGRMKNFTHKDQKPTWT